MLRIAVQAKGRLYDETMSFLSESGIKLSATKRTLLVQSSNFPIEVLFLRDDDIPQTVATGVADIGIVGENEFMEKNENVIFVGTSGVGKTHLAVGLGMAAAKRRISTYYITFNDLINQLVKANSENRADIKIKYFCKYKLLIIDEIGYLPITKEGAYLFFQLINKRYEKKSTILTTNQVFSKWSDIFGDSVVTAAIIDRLVHHSHIIKIKGQSYRIRDRNIEMQRVIEKEGV